MHNNVNRIIFSKFLSIIIVFLLVFSTMIKCSAKIQLKDISGCLVGYEKNSIALIHLPSLKYKKIIKRDKLYDSPIYNYDKDELFYIQDKSKIIYYDLKKNKKKLVYSKSGKGDIKWLLRSKNCNFFYYLEFLSGRPPHKLVELNTNDDSHRIVYQGNIYPYQKPTQINNDTIILILYKKNNINGLHLDLCELDIPSGNIKSIEIPSDEFIISTTKEKLLIKHGDSYKVFRYPSLKLEEEIPVNILPSNAAIKSPICFVEDRYIIYWKWKGRKFGLGTYCYDIKKNKVTFLSRHMLWDMYFERE